jgi:hypothetical protein
MKAWVDVSVSPGDVSRPRAKPSSSSASIAYSSSSSAAYSALSAGLGANDVNATGILCARGREDGVCGKRRRASLLRSTLARAFAPI